VGEVTKEGLDKRWKALKVAEIVGLMGLMVNLCQTCDLGHSACGTVLHQETGRWS
jgi:hypothetical protein